MLALDWISPGHHSTRDLLGDVLKFGNVQDGAAGGILREAVGIKVETDFDGVFHDPGHVVMDDVVVGAVGKTDAERLEWFGEKQLANLFGRNHGLSVGHDCCQFNLEGRRKTAFSAECRRKTAGNRCLKTGNRESER